LETTALGYYSYLKMLAAGARPMRLQISKKAWFPQDRTPRNGGAEIIF
jgi:hypothetical protein